MFRKGKLLITWARTSRKEISPSTIPAVTRFTMPVSTEGLSRIWRATKSTSTSPARASSVFRMTFQPFIYLRAETASATCSRSHFGVEVAPHTPTDSPSRNQDGSNSAADPTK